MQQQPSSSLTSVPAPAPPQSYKRKMKKSNVVVLINIDQALYARLLLDITNIKPEYNLLNSGFSMREGQAKFMMGNTEGAERLLKEFESRKMDDKIQVYIEVS